MEKAVEAFLSNLRIIMAANAPWVEKKNAIVRQMTEEDKTNFGELMAWFAGEDLD